MLSLRNILIGGLVTAVAATGFGCKDDIETKYQDNSIKSFSLGNALVQRESSSGNVRTYKIGNDLVKEERFSNGVTSYDVSHMSSDKPHGVLTDSEEEDKSEFQQRKEIINNAISDDYYMQQMINWLKNNPLSESNSNDFYRNINDAEKQELLFPRFKDKMWNTLVLTYDLEKSEQENMNEAFQDMRYYLQSYFGGEKPTEMDEAQEIYYKWGTEDRNKGPKKDTGNIKIVFTPSEDFIAQQETNRE